MLWNICLGQHHQPKKDVEKMMTWLNMINLVGQLKPYSGAIANQYWAKIVVPKAQNWNQPFWKMYQDDFKRLCIWCPGFSRRWAATSSGRSCRYQLWTCVFSRSMTSCDLSIPVVTTKDEMVTTKEKTKNSPWNPIPQVMGEEKKLRTDWQSSLPPSGWAMANRE